MKNETILKKAIEIAIKNGYDTGGIWEQLKKQSIVKVAMEDLITPTLNCYPIIFSHEFAQAFWPEEATDIGMAKYGVPPWKYHLSNMVQKKKPLKYIEKFLELRAMGK